MCICIYAYVDIDIGVLITFFGKLWRLTILTWILITDTNIDIIVEENSKISQRQWFYPIFTYVYRMSVCKILDLQFSSVYYQLQIVGGKLFDIFVWLEQNPRSLLPQGWTPNMLKTSGFNFRILCWWDDLCFFHPKTVSYEVVTFKKNLWGSFCFTVGLCE